MAQLFNPSLPAYKSDLESQVIRNLLISLDSSHAGPTPPPYPTEGKWFFNTTDYSMNCYMFGAWRMIFKFNPATGQLEVVNGVIMAKQDMRSGVTPIGVKDGVNDTFTLPGGEKYVQGTLTVFLNGMQYNPPNIVQLGPSYKSFKIINDTLPQAGDELAITYVRG